MLSRLSGPVKALVLPWGIIFLILQYANTQDGGPNAISRFLVMRAMTEIGSFKIDGHHKATSDWSQTPDGHYFSNKPPGPMLLGFPVFLLVDQVPRFWEKGYRDEFGKRHLVGYFSKTHTSVLTQAVPVLVIVTMAVAWLAQAGVSLRALTFLLLSVFFGTTASTYFNNYSGHGFSAAMQLAALYFLLRGRWSLTGFFSGAALLSDYGFATQIPAFVAALFVAWRAGGAFARPMGQLAAGASVPAVLWIWYHTVCFGGPFTLPTGFENPIFLDPDDGRPTLWGVFHTPNPMVFLELLFGPSRGLLPTQPWVLLALPFGLFSLFRSSPTAPATAGVPEWARVSAAIYCVGGLLGLMVMNSAFNKWQGGNSAGPRYICALLPCFGLWLALELDRMPKRLRLAFEAGLGVSLLFRAVVYGSTILAPGYNLWWWYFNEYRTHQWTPQFRFTLFLLALGIGFWWQKKLLAKLGILRPFGDQAS